MKLSARDRLIVALDFESLRPALYYARHLADLVGMFKIGSQLFTAEGPHAIQQLAALGRGIFLDLKFHDIPNTVAGAVSAAARLPGVELVNVHALGGKAMMEAASEVIRESRPGRKRRPNLIAVTILTSMDHRAMHETGISGQPKDRVPRLAGLAQQAGLDGVVASVQEARAIRRACGRKFIIVTPGVRLATHPANRKKDDQARVATPAEAVRAGADYIVVGRPITGAGDPRAAAKAILQELAHA